MAGGTEPGELALRELGLRERGLGERGLGRTRPRGTGAAGTRAGCRRRRPLAGRSGCRCPPHRTGAGRRPASDSWASAPRDGAASTTGAAASAWSAPFAPNQGTPTAAVGAPTGSTLHPLGTAGTCTAARAAAPSATACTGCTPSSSGRPNSRVTVSMTSGMRDEPPMSSTASTSAAVSPADRTARDRASTVDSTLGPQHLVERRPVQPDLEVAAGEEDGDDGLRVQRQVLLGQDAVVAQPGQRHGRAGVVHVEPRERTAHGIVDVGQDRLVDVQAAEPVDHPPGCPGSRGPRVACARSSPRTRRRPGRTPQGPRRPSAGPARRGTRPPRHRSPASAPPPLRRARPPRTGRGGPGPRSWGG